MNPIDVYRKIALSFGKRLQVVDSRPSYVYDGKTIRVPNSEGESVEDMVSHEIGHLLVADQYDRDKIEWNLGPSPSSTGVGIYPISEGADRIEEEASVLGIMLRLEVEGREDAMHTYRWHGWNTSDGYLTFLSHCRSFLKNGMLKIENGRVRVSALTGC